MKAMILAAGRGNRMRPLTDHTPKPLVEVCGKPLIVHHLLNFAAAGITEVVINISHLAEKIQQSLGNGEQYGVTIQYSYEPIALETGGGIYQALPLLGDKPFVIISADIWTDYPLTKLKAILAPNHLAHLIMVDNPSFHPDGDFVLTNGYLNLGDIQKLTYASIGVIHPHLFKNSPGGFFRLADALLKPAIAAKQITGEHYHGKWANLGTIEEWQQLNNKLGNNKAL